ncbi:MAG TPA: GNAT family N-acetyltransferase [Allosphingosinicella sp.]|uniref:GNAT family N-acetyltransferase n=1 Tax=Allosphingosinicella sp. TaxID=2823234 RepID=UPI002F28DEC0
MVPQIETARLRLRAIRTDDLDRWAAVCADPEVVRHLGGTPFSREDTWRRLLATAGSWAMLGYGYWCVERKAGGGMIGHAGFADFKREMSPSIEGVPEMGWVFAREAQGQGYAGEAVAAGLAWADEALKGCEIAAIIGHENAASIRVAEKAGFSTREEALYKGEPILIFRRPARL